MGRMLQAYLRSLDHQAALTEQLLFSEGLVPSELSHVITDMRVVVLRWLEAEALKPPPRPMEDISGI